MKVNKETAEEIWLAYFGNVDSEYDPVGRLMNRNQHGTGNRGSWQVDHIWPKNPSGNYDDGANTFANVQPLSDLSNEEKSNDMQGKIGEASFAVNGVGTHEGKREGRMAIKVNEEWVWAYKKPNY